MRVLLLSDNGIVSLQSEFTKFQGKGYITRGGKVLWGTPRRRAREPKRDRRKEVTKWRFGGSSWSGGWRCGTLKGRKQLGEK